MGDGRILAHIGRWRWRPTGLLVAIANNLRSYGFNWVAHEIEERRGTLGRCSPRAEVEGVGRTRVYGGRRSAARSSRHGGTPGHLWHQEVALRTRLGIAEPLVASTSFVGAPLLQIGAASSTVSHSSDGRRATTFHEAMQGGGAS
jgi:hypothetical protein